MPIARVRVTPRSGWPGSYAGSRLLRRTARRFAQAIRYGKLSGVQGRSDPHPPEGHASSGELERVAGRWQAKGSGEHYRDARFRPGHRDADGKLVRKLIRAHASRPPRRILDAPCGSGRLSRPLFELGASRVLGLDASAEMLRARPEGLDVVLGRIERLPFRSASFDLVVACRLLHHVNDEDASVALLTELLRVCSGLLVFSFWEACSWPGLRRQLGWSSPDRAGRVLISSARLETRLRLAGGRVLGRCSRGGWFSTQVFVAAEPIAIR